MNRWRNMTNEELIRALQFSDEPAVITLLDRLDETMTCIRETYKIASTRPHGMSDIDTEVKLDEVQAKIEEWYNEDELRNHK